MIIFLYIISFNLIRLFDTIEPVLGEEIMQNITNPLFSPISTDRTIISSISSLASDLLSYLQACFKAIRTYFSNSQELVDQCFKDHKATLSTDLLGQSTHAKVFKGKQEGKDVAIKIINVSKEIFSLTEGEGLALTLPKAIQNVQRNIAVILHNPKEGTYHYVTPANAANFNTGQYVVSATISEQCEGNLREFFERKKISLSEFKQAIHEVAKTIHQLHQCDIVHQDPHEDNYFYSTSNSPENQVKLILADFGMAKKGRTDDLNVKIWSDWLVFSHMIQLNLERHFSIPLENNQGIPGPDEFDYINDFNPEPFVNELFNQDKFSVADR